MKKRKHAGVHHNRSTQAKRGSKNRSVDLDFDDIESGEDSDTELQAKAVAKAQDEAVPEETADEKRVRVAKEYLEKLAAAQREDDENDSGPEDDFFDGGIIGGDKDDVVNKQLLEDALEKAGKTSIEMAKKIWSGDLEPHCRSFRVSVFVAWRCTNWHSPLTFDTCVNEP